MKDLYKIIDQLCELSQKSPIGHKHAAAVIRNNRTVYAKGFNHYKAMLCGKLHGTIHAEESAIISSAKLRLENPWCILQGKHGKHREH